MGKWILVDERIPEIGSLVLVWKPAQWTHQYDLLRYTQESETHRKIIRRRDHQWWDGGWRITHWMPLPEKPEEESL
jgi:hypothetical protein